ncbi:N-acetylmuramoyl-L-alanine amidase [Candidatus Woesearchaeota archaeon]|nr:N-acetylmuramoyl-L-alanine amidase [Candidatus Woesearchaeota archaeon]
MEKRGQHTAVEAVLIPIFILITVFGLINAQLIAHLMKIQDITFFEKKFLAGDAATIIDALYAVPGNAIVLYSKDTKWFSFEFKQDEVAITDETAAIQLKTVYPIMASKVNSLSPVILNPKFAKGEKTQDSLKVKAAPIFTKVGKGITITDKQQPFPSIMQIPCDASPAPAVNTLLLDAGHGDDDFGFVGNSLNEKDLTAIIASNLGKSLIGLGFDKAKLFYSRKSMDKEVGQQNKAALPEKNGMDFILSIHIGENKGSSNNVKAYYLASAGEKVRKQSRSIGCLALNSLVARPELGITGISLLPTEEDEHHGAMMLDKSIPGIILEYGNIDSQESTAHFTDGAPSLQAITAEIAKALGWEGAAP